MTTVRINEAIRRLRGKLAGDERAAATDAALLDRFLVIRDEAAFAEIVRRHGAMVFGVCRRLLRHKHDAEDAFQATFLVLVRKGTALRQVRSIGCWLYGVARRTALEARRAAARRRVKEAGAMAGPAAEETQDGDVREMLDAEIERLPDKLRSPLLLCDLEGKTRKEAAHQLGWPEGTVASRLASARKMLAKRLTRRGISLGGTVLALALSDDFASAVPPDLASSTVRVAAGRALSSSGVSALVKGVVMTMLLKKLKTTVMLALMLTALGVGGSVIRLGGWGEARADDGQKPRNELEALRHENELLRLNLHVVLEKVHAQETELQSYKKLQAKHVQVGQALTEPQRDLILSTEGGLQLRAGLLTGTAGAAAAGAGGVGGGGGAPIRVNVVTPGPGAGAVAGTQSFAGGTSSGSVSVTVQPPENDPPTNSIIGLQKTDVTVQPTLSGNIVLYTRPIVMAEAALKKVREAKDERARRQAIHELDAALQSMKVHHAGADESTSK